MKLAPTMLMARVAFYLALLTLGGAALSVSVPDWQRFGVTPTALMKLTDTLLLMSIAMLLAYRNESSGKN